MKHLALLTALALLAACEAEAPPAPTPPLQTPSPRTPPDAPLELTPPDTRDAEAVALFYCAHTQGPVPTWLLADDFASVLTPEDARAARHIARDTRDAFAPRHLPRHLAFARFLARNTRCTAQRLKERTPGQPHILLRQRVPLVDEPSGQIHPPGISPEDAERAWLQAFEAAFTGRFRDGQLRAIAIPQPDGTFRLDAGIDERFGKPYRAEIAMRESEAAIRLHDWSRAREHIDAACDHEDTAERCEDARAALARAETRRAAQPEIDLHVEQTRLRGLAQTKGNVLRVLTIDLTNHSTHSLSGVWVELSWPNDGLFRCELQRAMPPGDDAPLSIGPEERATGYCRLPSTRLDVPPIDQTTTRVLDLLVEASSDTP